MDLSRIVLIAVLTIVLTVVVVVVLGVVIGLGVSFNERRKELGEPPSAFGRWLSGKGHGGESRR